MWSLNQPARSKVISGHEGPGESQQLTCEDPDSCGFCCLEHMRADYQL